MDPNNDFSTIRSQPPPPGRRSLPPANVLGPHEVLPTYPSSTLRNYYPPFHNASYSAHIPTFSPFIPLAYHVLDHYRIPLASCSQSDIPSLRPTPSVQSDINLENQQRTSALPFLDQRLNNHSRASEHIHSLSPLTFHQPQPVPIVPTRQQPVHTFAAPQPTHPILPHRFVPHLQPPYAVPAPLASNITSVSSSLPSTKDVPLLSGKLDWGPWHSAVQTLILNSNLLNHIADEPLPGACFDPGLWPTYPPVVHRGSTHNELQSFTDWWSRDGIASHILTSRLNPSVLGCLPIANERLGHRRSARVVYNTLRHQFGAGDYSAVMVIEGRLRQLRCLPTRGGVRIADFISVWRTSLNQMDAAGFLPGIRQLLSILADGLPHSTVAFINLYDTIMSSLNEPNKQLLPNIHLLFDRIINIENNTQRSRIMNPVLVVLQLLLFHLRFPILNFPPQLPLYLQSLHLRPHNQRFVVRIVVARAMEARLASNLGALWRADEMNTLLAER